MASKAAIPGRATPGMFVPGDPTTSSFGNVDTPSSRLFVILPDSRIYVA